MSGLVTFIPLVLSTNVLFGLIVAAVFLRFRERLLLPAWPLVLAGFGTGPFLVTVVLYYLLLLGPGVPPFVLLAVPFLVFMLLAWWAGPGWHEIGRLFKGIPRLFRETSMWFLLAGSALLFAITVVFLANKPLVDHDVLEYAVQGRNFLRDGVIRYSQYRFDAATGFHYVGLHGFSFPLLFTWEGLWGGFTGVSSDIWARSITMWYAWLLILFVWSLLRRFGSWVALAGSLVLTASLGFLFLVTIYHLDSMRIFFFTVSLAAFIAVFRAPGLERILLLAVLCAGGSFVHSIGAILSAMLWVVLLVMLPVPIRDRIRWTVPALGLMLALGGVHYVLDILFGTGWVFQDLVWY